MRHQPVRNKPKASPLLNLFSESLSRLPIRPADKIVVAVSGGADSVCLLHLFLKAGFLASLHVAHLNHGFREESDQEAVFVAKLCQSWGVTFTTAKRNVLATCKEMHLSKQEGARFVRYAFLHEVARAFGASVIALGHTADDQVETVLINTLRGAGPGGLCGMVKNRAEGGCVIIRPMLSITRNKIVEELRDAKISFIEDPSNQDRRYLRNKIRHELLPSLAEYNPRIKETLLRETRLLEEENDFIETHLANLIPTLDIVLENTFVSFNLSLFSSLHLALKRRVLRWGICRLRGNCRGIRFEHIETLLENANGKPLCLPNGMTAKKIGTRLILETSAPRAKTISPPEFEIPKEANQIDLPQWNLRLALSVHTLPHTPAPCSILFDFDTISSPLTIRGFRPGDCFCPLGMQGRHKKLQDFFVDMKVPKDKRDHVPLLVCSTGIVAVIGFRQDERFKVTETTQRIVCLQQFI